MSKNLSCVLLCAYCGGLLPYVSLAGLVIESVPEHERKELVAYSRMLIYNRRILVKIFDKFSNFMVSFTSWFSQISNIFVLSYFNGFTEGCNNNCKVLKRVSYGLHHFEGFKDNMLLLSQKNSTSYLDS